MSGFRLLAAGDCAIVAEFGDVVSEELNARVVALADSIERMAIPGISETVPTYRSLLVHYDPLAIETNELGAIIEELAEKSATGSGSLRGSGQSPARVVVIPVRYGERYGEDLDEVARHAGLTEEETIRIHSSRDYLVYMLGFLPGFAYLGGMDERLATPRLATPRRRIPAGSVAIGGSQTGVYPVTSPGGWRLIGSTPVRLYDPGSATPIPLRAGDRVRFRPIGDEEYDELTDAVTRGTYCLDIAT